MTQIHFPIGRASLSISGFEHSKEEKPLAKTDELGRFRIKGTRPGLVVPMLWAYSADAGLAAEPIYTKSDIAGHSLRFDGPDKTIRLVAGNCEVQMTPSEDQNLQELEGMPIRPSGAIFESELFRQAISTVSYAKPTAEVPVHIPSRLQYLLETKIDRSGAATIPCGLDVHTFRFKTPRDVWHDVVAQVLDGKRIQIPLAPDRELVGTIDGYATLPEGALDSLFVYSAARGRGSRVELTPDENGSFSTHIGSGKMNVWGQFKDNKVPFFIVGDLTTNVGNNRPGRIKLKVQRAATVRGRVTFEDGTPVAGAEIWVQTRSIPFQRAIGFTVGSSGKTDEDGWYELHVRPTQISRVSCKSLPESLAVKHSPGDVVVADTKRKIYKLKPGETVEYPAFVLRNREVTADSDELK